MGYFSCVRFKNTVLKAFAYLHITDLIFHKKILVFQTSFKVTFIVDSFLKPRFRHFSIEYSESIFLSGRA